jgi:hypothetical protein
VAPPDPEIVKKIVPRQGNLAAALKAATTPVGGGGASPAQSAIFKPKVNIVLKPEAALVLAPPPAPVMEQVATAPELSSVSDAPATIEIPLAEIRQLLPENIFRPGVAEGASLPDMISLSTSEILPQLPKGRVQVPLSVILAAFPSDLIDASVAGSGDLKIKIPLHLIIPRLPESVMSLPKDQVKQQVDVTIEMPFSERRVRPAPVEPGKLVAPEIPPPARQTENMEAGGVTTLMPSSPVAVPPYSSVVPAPKIKPSAPLPFSAPLKPPLETEPVSAGHRHESFLRKTTSISTLDTPSPFPLSR